MMKGGCFVLTLWIFVLLEKERKYKKEGHVAIIHELNGLLFYKHMTHNGFGNILVIKLVVA